MGVKIDVREFRQEYAASQHSFINPIFNPFDVFNP